uniref:Uncharacterized protein n=1 Tax=Anguilla anguilla TaxID=7936 RepID=A0A0E9RSY0_ANGAN
MQSVRPSNHLTCLRHGTHVVVAATLPFPHDLSSGNISSH